MLRKRLKEVGDLKLLIAVHEILFDLIDIDFNHYFAFKQDRATVVVLDITVVLLTAMDVPMRDLTI